MQGPPHPTEDLPEELASRLGSLGEPRYRAEQVFAWIHRRGVVDPAAMRNLPAGLRERLAPHFPPVAETLRTLVSADGTRKRVVRFADGAAVETVLMPTTRSGVLTQCLSTQVGCAMGCGFCHSGIAGLGRHLSAAEIVAQVRLGRDLVRAGERLGSIVYMGMGEPLHNYDAVVRSIRLLTHPKGLALSKRRVTLSTVGLVPEMDRLGRDLGGDVALAVSLHAGTSEVRRKLVPIEKRYSLESVVDAIRRYPLRPRSRVTIEYALVAGENDDLEQADRLAALLAGMPVKVNLIPLNEHEGTAMKAPGDAHVSEFQERLAARGLSVFVRRQRGNDIAAACGQLALRGTPRGRHAV